MGTAMYSLSLHAAQRPASRLRMAGRHISRRTKTHGPRPAMNSGRRGLSASRARGRRASGRRLSSSGWPTGRASSAKLARSGAAPLGWHPCEVECPQASQRGIAQLWDGVSEFSQRRFDVSERGGHRGRGVPRACRGPEGSAPPRAAKGLVVELVRRITLGGAQRGRLRAAPNSICRRSANATEPRKAGYGRQWGLSCSPHVSTVARLGRMCGRTHPQGQPFRRSLADAVPQTTPDAHALATALPATRRRRVRLEHRG